MGLFEGTPPYNENDAPAGTEHTTLFTRSQKTMALC